MIGQLYDWNKSWQKCHFEQHWSPWSTFQDASFSPQESPKNFRFKDFFQIPRCGFTVVDPHFVVQSRTMRIQTSTKSQDEGCDRFLNFLNMHASIVIILSLLHMHNYLTLFGRSLYMRNRCLFGHYFMVNFLIQYPHWVL